MSSESQSRFSDEDLAQCHNWLLPDVSSERVLPSAEKEEKERQRLAEKEKNDPNAPLNPDAGESIEDEEISFEPLTADQLKEITEAAEKDGYENGYQKGYELGLSEGQEAGYKEAMAKGELEIRQQSERLHNLLEALLTPLEAEQKNLQIILLDMVSQLTQAVVQRELQLDSSNIVQLVDAAINTVPASADKFSLYLNSADVALVEAHLHSNLNSLDKQFTYHIDDQLIPGGCRLETKQTVVDYSVEHRLENVINDFLQRRYANPEAYPLEDIHKEKNTEEERRDKKNDGDESEKNNSRSNLEKAQIENSETEAPEQKNTDAEVDAKTEPTAGSAAEPTEQEASSENCDTEHVTENIAASNEIESEPSADSVDDSVQKASMQGSRTQDNSQQDNGSQEDGSNTNNQDEP